MIISQVDKKTIKRTSTPDNNIRNIYSLTKFLNLCANSFLKKKAKNEFRKKYSDALILSVESI